MDARSRRCSTRACGHYRELAEHGFALPGEPHGVLMLAARGPARRRARGSASAFPELQAEGLAPGRAGGARAGVGADAGGRAAGTPASAVPPADARVRARATAAARGRRAPRPRSRRPCDGARRRPAPSSSRPARGRRSWSTPPARGGPIEPLWGVVVEVRLAAPPRHALEEAGIDGCWPRAAASRRRCSGSSRRRPCPRSARRSCPTAGPGRARAAAARARGPLRAGARGRGDRRGARLRAAALGRRAAAAGPRRADVVIAAGHGPWGISLGPASARLVADLVLGREPAIPPAFDPARFA